MQAVVARAAPTNLVAASNNPFTGIYMPPPPPGGEVDKSSLEYKTLQDASPISYISADDPPFLLMHGTADTTVLPSQSIEFEKALKAAGIPAKLILVAGAGHGPPFP
ncbi:MAG: prolyl oligopeptidase family serine peptidase, partial [Phycisphaerales bacterium]|nr:prolyl oligopeptidase family serine peptidase [Phycisphaerales bacterium]